MQGSGSVPCRIYSTDPLPCSPARQQFRLQDAVFFRLADRFFKSDKGAFMVNSECISGANWRDRPFAGTLCDRNFRVSDV
ncbi:MAG TPA: hypothetical protein DCR20_14385 [Planctomycetaceae bacterium]|nr:hypothetical protein [Planctomycetaceae bacterium]HCP12351.1 hypothetical protein [Planctomycetaceae bacterium]